MIGFSGSRWIFGIVALALAAAPTRARPPADGLTVERVVLLMRHGVRPPTKSPPLPAGFAADPWPTWPVKPGYLTPHGANAAQMLARWDRRAYRSLLGEGCPAPGAVAMISDSDERTIHTGDAYLEGVAPGCHIDNQHKPQDVPDALFSPIDEGAVRFDAGRARVAVIAALPPGGLAALDKAARPALKRIDRIYRCCAPAACPPAAGACTLAGIGTALAPPERNKRPKLIGGIDIGSTAAQVLLLQYAEGKPMREVGWGRATPTDIEIVSGLHALEFQTLARPRYVAAANIALIAERMLAALTAPDGAALTLLIGHDTNVASLGGLLDLHWQAPGYARDDPPPGGAIGFELLRDRAGRRFVRAVFRAQTLEQLRAATPLDDLARPYRLTMPIPGCQAAQRESCPLPAFRWLLANRLKDVALPAR